MRPRHLGEELNSTLRPYYAYEVENEFIITTVYYKRLGSYIGVYKIIIQFQHSLCKTEIHYLATLRL